VGLPEQEAKEPMSNQLTSIFKLTGIASLVLFVGATARPITAASYATAFNKPLAIPAVLPTAPVTIPTAVPAASLELLHDAPTTITTAIPAARHYRTIRMEVTAYCPCTKCCGENAQGITASGHDISYNNSQFVAADTDHLPFGTKLLIPGYGGGAVEVIDRGGAIKGHKLDVFFPTHEEALQWGRQWVDVTVVE